ncbi:MAG TPA: hypothetical protein VGV90_00090 [Solirubrobacteraceae bacterium]|nr:hypothetical protein [Solirubrobacteraceae bacterium]
MGLVIATTVGLCAWVVLWAIGWTAMDAFLVTSVIITLGATARLLRPYLPGRRPQTDL